MSAFFIVRPIFASVIAIVVMLGGLLALAGLPVSQYPEIAPPTIQITATYPGADARTVENSVTKIIEQGMTGLDHLDYMTSTSTSTGQADITLTFTNAANPDVAQMQVQNKLQLVTALLPTMVQSNGLTVTKSSSAFLMVVGFVSTDGRMTDTDLSDYVKSALNDTLKRVEGVGATQLFGAGYAMRIWLDPDRLAKYALNPSDVASAIQAQNAQVSAGQLGGLPARRGQQLNATVTAQSRLQTPEQFRNLIVKSAADGSLVRIGDVATVELGAEDYVSASTYNGAPATGLAINLATGANAVRTAAAVKAAIDRLAPTFPEGVKVVYPYDTTPFVKISIEQVTHTLIEAIALVFLVMLAFLHNIRATLIPTLAVPVVLLGTFGVLAVAGYSINTLTMFAMVLAIGLLVDDAIVVVENVERIMHEEGLSPREATIKSMSEITGALIGITTVLSAVFVPMAFFGGSVGVIYRQFSVTIVSAMALSVGVALILTPALCATLLRPPRPGAEKAGLFRWFDRNMERGADAYRDGAAAVLRRPRRGFAALAVMTIAAAVLFTRLPSSFLPQEDQGYLMVSVQLPVGATSDRTERALDRVTRYFLDQESKAVDGVMTVRGFAFSGLGQNVGMAFVGLRDFSEREASDLSAVAVTARATAALAAIRDAQVFVLAPPAIEGLGTSSGFDFYLEDMTGSGHEKLLAARDHLLADAARSRILNGVRPNGQDDTPQFAIDVYQEKASALGIDLATVNATLSTAWGGAYVNDFIDRGRVKKVFLQSAADFRMQPDDLDRWHVRTASGEMAPFSSFASGRWAFGSPRLERYNGSPAVQIQGEAGIGASSGDAMTEIDRLVAGLPPGFSHEWTSLSRQERLSGNQAIALYAISVIVVFLCLAALYESWTVPLAVMLCAPIGVLGALVAALMFGQANDVYFKVGLLTTIGLVAKNAILIVEFAIDHQKAGMDAIEATLLAARQRLRPIVMTSFAFILGVAPLAFASGAGSAAQNAIGVGVMGGMIAATALAIFFVPLLFVTTLSLSRPGKQELKFSGQPHGWR
ncbi:efflux RND transporter permease subunit [Methylosinus sporium]|uniref:Efflux pump membrane transporter n=1 Tax=Methylosinus sporium TaxID=428 RepID=A0A549SE42_METSR|nr:efflux RND transporter permease subunit [Methylosinus sporium]TRL27088.1 efflux RND transporter permease subunit [Methylosinus sporium]